MKRLHLSQVCLRRSTIAAFGNPRSIRPTRKDVVFNRRAVKGFSTQKGETAIAEKTTVLDPTAPAIMTIEDIMSTLPHRYPRCMAH